MSLADAFDLLSRNKNVGDDFFRSICASPSTKYPAVRDCIAAFEDAGSKKRIMNKPVLVGRYVRVLLILVECEQHVQHLSVADWGALVRFLGLAYEKFGAEARDLGFVKNASVLFNALMLLLECYESVDVSYFGLILEMCNDFCGPGPQRETSCHQFIMACVRILTQMRFEEAHVLGNRLIQMGKPRHERLRREMFAFACLVPQTMDDLLALGPQIIDPCEVEFAPAPKMGFPWFRPSPEAELWKYIAARALSSQLCKPASQNQDGNENSLSESATKRQKKSFDEISLMARAFGQDDECSSTTDLLAGTNHSFWLFVVLAQRVSRISRPELLDVWKFALDHLQYKECASSASFCLAQLVPRLVNPANIDSDVVARLKTLLVNIGESSHLQLSSGSVMLYEALSRVQILDREFQRVKNENLKTWLSRSIKRSPESLLVTFFGQNIPLSHIDSRGIEDLEMLESFTRVSRVIRDLTPNALDDPGQSFEPFEGFLENNREWVQDYSAHGVRNTLWSLALIAHSNQPVSKLKSPIQFEAVSNEDIRAIVWFADLASSKCWSQEVFNFALSIVTNLNLEHIGISNDLRRSFDLALAVLEDPFSELANLIAGHPESVRGENPAATLRSLQPIFQSYVLQRSPSVAKNVLHLMNRPAFRELPECDQLKRYFFEFVSQQSPFSRLRPALALLLAPDQDFIDLVSGSSLDSSLLCVPSSITSDTFALTLLQSLHSEAQKSVGYISMVRGASVGQVLSLLLELKLMSPLDVDKVTGMLDMCTPQNLFASIATPLLFGRYSENVRPLAEFLNSETLLNGVDSAHGQFLSPPQSLDLVETAIIIEGIMRNCSYLSSFDEKIECVQRCGLFARAHASRLPSELLRSYIKSVIALFESKQERCVDALGLILKPLLEEDSNGILAYADFAIDLEYIGLSSLAEKFYETTDKNLVKFMRFLETVQSDPLKAPDLVFELSQAKGATFEVWKLVIGQLVTAAKRDLVVLVEAFRSHAQLSAIVSALQVWNTRLHFREDSVWMAFMGYLTAEVGDALPKVSFLGSLDSQGFLSALLEVFEGLPCSKKWHLHPFMRRLYKSGSSSFFSYDLPRGSIADSSYSVLEECFLKTKPRHPSKRPVPPACVSSAEMSNKALFELGLPSLGMHIFEEIPELMQDFLPLLLVAGLRTNQYSMAAGLLAGCAEEREIGLRFLQRYYEATKKLDGPKTEIIDACKAVGNKFAELGIASVEMMWGSRETLTTDILTSLQLFYDALEDKDFNNIVKIDGQDQVSLSNVRMNSIWQEVDFNMISFEANECHNKLQTSLERTGLWKLAFKSAAAPDYYDYKRAWWLQQWDLPSAPQFETSFSSSSCSKYKGDRVFAVLFNLFGDSIDETEAFAQLARIDYSSPVLLKNMISGDSSSDFISSQLVRQGRELIVSRSGESVKLATELQTFCAILRDSGELNDAVKYALKLEQLADANEDSAIKVLSTIESSHTAWSLGDQSLAISMLQTVITTPTLRDSLGLFSIATNIEDDLTLAKVYCRLGTWSRLARHESDETIWQRFFKKAEILSSDCDEEQVHHYFALFCDTASHDSNLNEELKDLSRMSAQRQREVEHLEAAVAEVKTDRDSVVRKLHHARKALKSEAADFLSLQTRKKELTLKSVESYLKSMRAGDSYKEDMNRFVALWLELVDDAAVNQLIYSLLNKDGLTPLLTLKFLPWMNQLSSRLSKSDTPFQNALQLVLTTCLEKHPYHTIWQLINLYWSGSATDKASMSRKAAAKEIMERVRNMRSRKSHLLRDLSACAKQMVTLMKIPVEKKTKALRLRDLGGTIDRWWRRELVKLALPVPTATLIPQIDGDYAKVPKVVSVDSDITVAGGLSSPKIISFVDSEGITSHMVLKHGTDDLRQDAIMQQVFGIANEVLAASKGRSLRVRTYNVIPLGPSGGAIEFVEGARSLQEVLEPLHEQYGGTQEYSLIQARTIMRDVQRADRTTRINAFKDVMAHTQPQMRNFWPTQMPDIHSWLSAKTTWCRSTAVMSIIGYVVGLGDRHCSNLLIDTVSGEVVHIDLGIAFDQGRLLSIPETVPFRLTRDMVDGMGVCGVDGPFTRSAQTTLSLVREQQSRIMTVLEVLKHDSLYSWRLPPLRVKQTRAGSEDDGQNGPASNSMGSGQAESALRLVKQKLSSNLNVEATVRDLVARARDTSNLALIFCGWSPFY